jgi:serine/threonine protein kinase
MNTAARSCAKCGAALSAGSALDVCPQCVAPQILAPATLTDGSASAVEPPTRGSPRTADPLERPGDRIGRYKLLEKIGEGGCGVVYVAEQAEPVRRRVALKVIKLGMDTRQVVARFEAERQALAMMDHPHIAKVFDGGTTASGRPFFVMELVRGLRITDYCDENHLSTSQRLDLFIQVCHAVQHAHQKGIIHRDLKPSNILVTINDGVAVPKVIDFGVAKATSGQPLTDKTVYTAFEQFIGTPAYMSPEQTLLTSLDIDTRSDIYSLGVLLYELLTGRLPFDPKELFAKGLDEIRRTIREQEPPRPSVRLSTLGAGDLTTAAKRRSTDVTRLIHDIRGDLDWVVTKCLEKDRNRRYETANGLAADIQRHLKNEPIVARPPSRLYSFRRLVRRNKVAFTAAAAVLVALLAGLGFSTWALVRERAARQQAALEAAKSKQVAKFLKDMIWDMKPSVAMGRDTTLMREFADRTYEQLSQDLTTQPDVQAELRASLGKLFHVLEDHRKAEAIHRDNLPRMKSLLGDEHERVADLMRDFACVLEHRGKHKESEALARETLALARKRRGEEHTDTAHSLGLIAVALAGQKKYAEAVAWQRQSQAIYLKLRGAEDRDYSLGLANLADWFTKLGNTNEAELLYRESLVIRRKKKGDTHPEVVVLVKDLARFHVGQGRLDEAEKQIRELLAAQRKALGNENREVAKTLAFLAAILIDNGRPAEGEPLAHESVELHRKLYGEQTPEVAGALNDLGVACYRVGRLAEAESFQRQSYEICRRLLPPDSSRLANSRENLDITLIAQGKFAEVKTVRQERVANARQNAATDPKALEQALYDFAEAAYRQQDYAGAEPVYRELIQRRSSRLSPEHEDVFGPNASLGRLLADWAWTGRSNAVAADVRRLTPKSKLRDASSKSNQSLVTSAATPPAERAREAERLLRQSLAYRLQGTNITHWRTGDMRSRLGGALLSVAITDSDLTLADRAAKLAQAEALLLEGNDRIPSDRSSARTYKRDALERLICLYEAWNKPAQAAEWRGKLTAFEKSKDAEASSPPVDAEPAP